MATIRDVARHAGVSIATVSAAMNDSGPVSEKTRKRVWDAAAAVGYSPNAIARSLRLGKSRLIGLVVGDITNPFWASMVRVVEAKALAAKLLVIVCNTDDDVERELAILDQLRAQHVAGILLTPLGQGAGLCAPPGQPQPPPIGHDGSAVPGLARDFVGVDNRAAASMLAEVLIRLGHRRIAMITGPAAACGRRRSGSPARRNHSRRGHRDRSIALSENRLPQRRRRMPRPSRSSPAPTGQPRSSAATTSSRSARCRQSSISAFAAPPTSRSSASMMCHGRDL